jgi:tetratricopeptide (TPR) repeat protein
MYKMRCLSVFIAILLMSFCALAQSPKKYFSAAEKFREANNIKDAIDNYSKAIDLDPNFEKAYIARALCYEKQNRKEEAIEDYKKLIIFSPKEKELYYNAGRLYSEIGKHTDADQMLRKALERDNGYQEAIDLEIQTIYKTKDYTYGVQVAQMALDIKKNAVNYHHHAVMYDSLKNYTEAEKEYKSSKYYDSKYIPAYVGLAIVQAKLNKAADALATCEAALVKDPNSIDVFLARSIVYSTKKEFQSALNDITKVVVTAPNNYNHKLRAAVYMKLGQFQNAANDYSQAIKLNEKDIDAYLGRAGANELAQNYKAVLADYNKIASIAPSDPKIVGIVKEARKKVFELSRENNKPEISLSYPKSGANLVVKVSGSQDDIIVKGEVKDVSAIKSIKVNNTEANFHIDSLNPWFTVKVTGLTKANEIVVTATDVYDNSQTTTFKIEKTETNKPIIALETPAASFDNEIFLDNNGSDLYIQGKIKDESLIESIMIEGVAASYAPSSVNPDFNLTVSVANKTRITIVVKDVYGNENTQNYTLNRSGAEAALNNPMGNTWVVFIENGKYQNFASLEGPGKDVMMMKSALANYKVTKILHKKDMTKTEMEKFFSIELRDYVKNNNINSLLIWYAGHGKYVSPTGYWVPVDAKTDDEFSFFGINNLKAAMQSYSHKLVHTLVITDACESGATFLLAMRGSEGEQRCENWELTKAKSSQVFTSAGYELASDNSQFTKTFASSLNNNPDACIAIDKIVKKVTSSVQQAGNQAPKFGKIKDLEDEGGTFFFIKK